MGGTSRGVRTHGWQPVLVMVSTGLVLVTACGGARSVDRVRPLDAAATSTSEPATGPLGSGDGAAAAPAPAPAPAASGDDPPTADQAGNDLRRTVDELLGRYDRALTALAAHPGATQDAGDPGDPDVQAWRQVVTPGTALAEDVPAAVRARLAGGTVVVPGPSGTSYRHRSLAVVRAAAGVLSFTWCSWSPGIGRDRETGAVTDDAVGHAHGTGRARVVGGTWQLDALDQSDLEALPAGSPDPCPAEVARSATEGTR